MYNKTDTTIGNIFQIVVKSNPNQSEDEKKGPKAQKKTIWHKFSSQMQDLMLELAEPLLDFKQES